MSDKNSGPVPVPALIPNDKLRGLCDNEETQFMSLLLRDKGLMADAMRAGFVPQRFQNEAMRRLFSMASEHFDKYDGSVLSRPALEGMLASSKTPEEAAKIQSQYDRTVATFGVTPDDYAHLKEGIENRWRQYMRRDISMREAEELLTATRGQDKIMARYQAERDAVGVASPSIPEAQPAAKPWRLVTTENIKDDIRGTRLEKMVDVLASVSEPPLPLELTLPKALTLVGAAMSRPRDQTWRTAFGDDDDPACGMEPKTGPAHLRLRINTAGGQACSVWALIVAESGVGKDIGNIPSRLAMGRGWLVGSSGSGEGLKDAFVQLGSGLMTVSELQPFLDRNRWQYGCTDFLTAAFNSGWFKEVLSKASKSGGHVRQSAFCYPSVLAAVQPEVLRASQGTAMLASSGFLPRFLVSVVEPGKVWRPKCGEVDIRPALAVLENCEAIEGVVEMPQGYLQDVMDEFAAGDAAASTYCRLINEYAPRFAVMLATDPVHPTPEDLAKAGRLARWFYSMAEKVMLSTDEDAETRETNKLIDKILALVKSRKTVGRRELVRKFWRVPIRRREQAINQMVSDGLVKLVPDGKGSAVRLVEEP